MMDTKGKQIMFCIADVDIGDKPFEQMPQIRIQLMLAAPALLEALEEITEMYCRMINSGDCGNWNPEEDKEVIKARAAIASAKGE